MTIRINLWISRMFFLLFLGIFVAGCAHSADQHAFAAQTIQFDGDKIGAPPSGFSTALTGDGGTVSWLVQKDLTAPGVKKVLRQESADTNNYRFPLCIYNRTTARDIAVQVDFKAISGKLDQAGGIVLRYTPQNYYIARANALENNVILFKTVNGKRSKILEVPAKVAPNQWHTLRFEARDAELKIIFDGKLAIETNDLTFSSAGKIGLWTKADSVTAFANVKIEPIR